MKGKLLKKIVAGAATLAMATQFAFALPASAAVTGSFLSTDFSTNATSDNYTWGTFVTISNNDSLNGSNISFTGEAAVIGGSTSGDTPATLVTFNNAIGGATEDLGISFKLAKRYNGEVNSEMISFNDASGNTLFGIKYEETSRNGYNRKAYLVSNDKTIQIATYTDNAWVNFEIYASFASGNGYVTANDVTLPFNGTAVKSISLQKTGNTQNRGMVLDDLKIDKNATASKYLVNYVINEEGYENSTYTVVDANGHPTGAPSTDIPGINFVGWTDGETTSKELADFTITKPTTLTATYGSDPNYIERIENVAITGPASMTFGADPDTAADNNYTLTITGEKGTVITNDTIDQRISDFKIEWDISGFKTGNDTEDQYCDSYGAFYDGKTPMSSANPGAVTSPTFKLRNVPMNFFGKMTAKVTYKSNTGKADYDVDQTMTATYYVVALGDTTTTTSQILPKGGYPSDFDTYPSSFAGYAVNKETYGSGTDVVVGGIMSGSDGSGSAVITEENDNKFLRVTAATVKKSHMYTYKIDTPTTQAIFEQDVRFNATGGTLLLASRWPFSSTDTGAATPVVLSFDGTNVKLNGVAVSKDDNAVVVSSGTWYRAILSVDKTTESAYAMLYSADGTLLGETGNVEWSTKNTNPVWYSIGFGGGNDTGTIDFDNYSAYYATADTSTFNIASTGDSLSTAKPEETIDLTASLKTADGYEMTGAATWSVVEEDMADSVVLTPDANDSHKVNVALTSDAVPGTATIQVNIGGYTKTKEIDITSSSASVKFTKSVSSISIPLEASKTSEAVYEADVVNGEGERINGTTLAIYDKNNANEYTLPDGITFDAATGKLTVTSAASAVTFTVRATGVDNDNNKLTRAVKVTVHGLAFDFGAAADEPAEGYTAVTPSTSYSEKQGYGIASGSVTAGGTSSESDANGDYLSGAMTFKANVEKGHFYTVSIVYQGTLSTGYVNSDLAGYELGTNETLTTGEYTLPVVVDNIDLTVSGSNAKIASVTITKQADREPNAKPAIRQVGDSTAANSGSWAYYIDHNRSSFPELDALATFYNNGAGGRNLCTYYTQGKLASVLRELKPGDIMMFGNNGTNGMGSTFEEDVNYYLDAAEALGAKIIINSYTPHGAVSGYASGYDATTYTFDSYRKDSYDVIVRRVAEERAANDENYIGFVEIGKYADESFTAYVQDGADATEKAARATEIISCFSDHNHYDKGSKARELMLNGYTPTTGDNAGKHIEGAVEQIVALLAADEPEPEAPKLAITATNTTDFTVKVGGVEKANGDELAVGDVITIAAADDTKEIVSATGFTVANGVATYTVKDSDKTVTISEVVVADKPSADFSVTFTKPAYVANEKVTINAEVTGKGTKSYTVYLAVYDGGALESVKSAQITISDEQASVDIPYTGSKPSVYIWDGGLVPYSTDTAPSEAL